MELEKNPTEESQVFGVDPGARLMTVSQVAKYCQVSAFTVRRWIWNKTLKACLIGCRVRIVPSDLNAFIRDNTWTPKILAERRERRRRHQGTYGITEDCPVRAPVNSDACTSVPE